MPLLCPLTWLGQHLLPVCRLLLEGIHPLLTLSLWVESRAEMQRSNEIVSASVIIPDSDLQHPFFREFLQGYVLICQLLLPDWVHAAFDYGGLPFTRASLVGEKVALDDGIHRTLGSLVREIYCLFDKDMKIAFRSRIHFLLSVFSRRELETKSQLASIENGGIL